MSRVTSKNLALFNRFLGKSMGLHFPAHRLEELEQKMAAAAREFGYAEVEPCLLWLMSEPLSSEQLDVLARHLTIGETYFLRDADSYRALAEKVLPELIRARRKGKKRLTIWSAGCSTGEEAYSIAILLSRVLPDLDRWEIDLRATDINPQALEKARQGIYGAWSFRSAPPWLYDYLVPCGSGRYQIAERIKKLVSFARLNLATESYDALCAPGGADIIFCRNVMLYMHHEQKVQLTAKFHRTLGEGGWLFVSPTEVDHRLFHAFSCRRFAGALAFRKGGEPAAEESLFFQELPPSWREAVPRTVVTEPVRGREGGQPDQPVRSVAVAAAGSADADDAGRDPGELPKAPNKGGAQQGATAGGADAESLELLARHHAGGGKFDEARRCCEEALAADCLRPGTHYLLSTILEEQGFLPEAAASLRRTLYLDPDFIPAHFALGNLDRRAGRVGEAHRHFRTALRLLERRDQGEIVTEAAGLTAGRLAEIIRATL